MLTLSPPEQLAWRGFLHAHDALWKALERGLEADGLNLPAYELLTTLEEAGEGGMRMSDLAARLRFSGGGLTRLVDRLEGAGFVQRRRCEADGRGFEVTLTPEGRSRLRRVHARHLREVRALFLSRLTPQEIEVLGQVWKKLPPLAP
ncbi:DNA-binding transcriptional regulator, MarR family [Deinococcus reticulitermitis]|uniref:DNA-binding transcriptional regulator, MarR family n=1 Tax=Deinococcus reticulitermitis TaxID=856736 RepID=A0A1H6ZD53_9DEIO|nr:MarR family transcriptional regulator [Deinococcus reticulitermitis]SEJ51268.1 DNA-binding transcriptional regulator, MarR family [Deinococcus reticulitermitis]